MGKEQKKMFVMMGIQGSGKSTFCARFLADAVRVNLDTLHTRNKEALLIAECMEKGCDFVVDNTNPTWEDRARYIPKAKEAGYHVTGYFMQSRIQDCIQRNAQREGKARVPNGAIAMTSNKLEMPSYEEGFDELYFVKNENDNMEICEWRNEDEL